MQLTFAKSPNRWLKNSVTRRVCCDGGFAGRRVVQRASSLRAAAPGPELALGAKHTLSMASLPETTLLGEELLRIQHGPGWNGNTSQYRHGNQSSYHHPHDVLLDVTPPFPSSCRRQQLMLAVHHSCSQVLEFAIGGSRPCSIAAQALCLCPRLRAEPSWRASWQRPACPSARTANAPVDAKALRPGLRLTQDQVRPVGLTPRPSRIGSSDVALPIGLRIGFGEERPHWLRELVVQSGPNRRVPLLKRLADLLFRSPTEPPCYLA